MFALAIVLLPTASFAHATALCSAGGSGGAYVGPLDVVSAPRAFYSFRCGSNAYAGNVADIWDATTGSTTETLLTCSKGGVLNQTVNSLATTCAVSCSVKTIYDQSGNGFDMTQSVNADRLVVTVNCTNGHPCLATQNNGSIGLSNGTFTSVATIPSTVSVVGNMASGVDEVFGGLTSGFASVCNIGHSTGNLWKLDNGTVVSQSATDNAWHFSQGVCNGASSVFNIDGTDHTVSAGSASLSSATQTFLGFGTTIGKFTEMGLWPVGFSATQRLAMAHNQCVYFIGASTC